MVLCQTDEQTAAAAVAEQWPAEVDFILSALEAGRQENSDGGRPHDRVPDRVRYHVRAELTLFSEGPGASPRILYTRDANSKGLGFITRQRLPLGYGGRVRLTGPNGQKLCIDCTLLRCHESIPGWFEGALYFNREQWVFSKEEWPGE